MKLYYLGLFICLFISALACGGDDEEQSDTTESTSASTTFECYDGDASRGRVCSTESQYCLQERGPTSAVYTGQCTSLPESCSGCECAQQAALDKFGNSTNCKGGPISCGESNGQITVTCVNKPLL